MKLRNKKTGTVGYLVAGLGINHYVVTNDDWDSCGEYDTLAELNEEWEDYEEPLNFWYIDDYDTMLGSVGETQNIEYSIYTEKQVEKLKAIGNYFETEEAAEKAVEKLKAWKRLKDKGFERVFRLGLSDALCGGKAVAFELLIDDKGSIEDIKLLFGGEE